LVSRKVCPLIVLPGLRVGEDDGGEEGGDDGDCISVDEDCHYLPPPGLRMRRRRQGLLTRIRRRVKTLVST